MFNIKYRFHAWLIWSYRVNFPNNDGKKFTHLVGLRARLFYTWFKIFLYIDNPWILLFPMVYKHPCFSIVLREKSAVYDQGVHLSLSGIDSLIPTLSQIFSLITTLQQNTSKNRLLTKKNFVRRFLLGKGPKVFWTIL